MKGKDFLIIVGGFIFLVVVGLQPFAVAFLVAAGISFGLKNLG